MEAPELVRELLRFDPEVGVESAWTPPASWYLEPAFYDWEVRQVLSQNWQPVAHLGALRGPGDHVTGCFTGQPYVVVRGDDGELRAFYNVCRHHAALVADGEQRISELVCPYHGWTYDLRGRLRSAPQMGGVRDFPREEMGLVPIPVEAWGPFVFLHMGAASTGAGRRSLQADLAPISGKLGAREGGGELHFVARREYELECNWKVFVDNYLDGGYHVGHLHRGLASQLELGGYENELFERVSLQTCRGAAGAVESGGDFAERIGGAALYAYVYPGFMINRYGPVMDTNWVVPLGPTRTRVVFDYFFEDGSDDDQVFVERCLAASHTVQCEDERICAAVQRGLASAGYDQGRYAPGRELPAYAFHRLLWRELRASLPAGAGQPPC